MPRTLQTERLSQNDVSTINLPPPSALLSGSGSHSEGYLIHDHPMSSLGWPMRSRGLREYRYFLPNPHTAQHMPLSQQTGFSFQLIHFTRLKGLWGDRQNICKYKKIKYRKAIYSHVPSNNNEVNDKLRMDATVVP